MSNTPKILYVEDELAQNIPRLLNLFATYLGESERSRLNELESDLDGYGASPEEIQQIFKSIEFIELEYRFPAALAKVLNSPEDYSLFIVDRNLAHSEYTLEEIRAIDPGYSEDTQKQFSDREGDYLLVKLVTENKVAVLDKFYFLTAFSAQDEIRGIQHIKDRIDIVAFQHKNFIGKGSSEIQLLRSAIVASPVHNPAFYQQQFQSSWLADTYNFELRDRSIIKGAFLSPVIKLKMKNGKPRLVNTPEIKSIHRDGPHSNADFRIELKTGNILQGKISNWKIKIETQLNPPIYQIVPDNIKSIELV